MIKRRIPAILIAIAAALAGPAATAAHSTRNPPAADEREARAERDRDRLQGRRAMRRLERSSQSRIGVFALDTGSGRRFSYRAGSRFPIASNFKAYACAAVLERARRSGDRLMDRRLTWTRDEVVEFSPISEKHVEGGLTVSELCDAAIRYSDNTAGNLILDQIGGPKGFTRYMRSLGDRTTRLDRTEPDLNKWKPGSLLDTTTPKAAGRSLEATTLDRSIPQADRRQLIDWLIRNTTGDKRIRAGVPRSYKVGDKTGTAGSYGWGNANDVAIAWPPGKRAPIVISVFTNRLRADASALNSHIARAAKIALRGLRVGVG